MSAVDGIRLIFEAMAIQERFNMNQVARAIQGATGNPASLTRLGEIAKVLGTGAVGHILKGLLRFAFLIELVKVPKIESTKFEVRWASRLGPTDPRYATYDDCVMLLDQAIADLEAAVHDASNQELLGLLATRPMVPYEIPLDYLQRSTCHLHGFAVVNLQRYFA